MRIIRCMPTTHRRPSNPPPLFSTRVDLKDGVVSGETLELDDDGNLIATDHDRFCSVLMSLDVESAGRIAEGLLEWCIAQKRRERGPVGIGVGDRVRIVDPDEVGDVLAGHEATVLRSVTTAEGLVTVLLHVDGTEGKCDASQWRDARDLMRVEADTEKGAVRS